MLSVKTAKAGCKPQCKDVVRKVVNVTASVPRDSDITDQKAVDTLGTLGTLDTLDTLGIRSEDDQVTQPCTPEGQPDGYAPGCYAYKPCKYMSAKDLDDLAWDVPAGKVQVCLAYVLRMSCVCLAYVLLILVILIGHLCAADCERVAAVSYHEFHSSVGENQRG